jgi:succinylarginine dihydrolase
MKDVANREIKVGDRVAYSGKHYSGLSIGYVISLTPRGANVHPRKDAHAGLWRGSDQLVLIKENTTRS